METPIGIIPARLGSRRLPRKNIAPLGGRPLLEWTLDAAIQSGIFEPGNIFVSTESFPVGLLAWRNGVAWASAARIPTIANDAAQGVEDVVRHLEMIGGNPVYYILLATTPFRSPESIRAAWAAFTAAASGVDGLLSVVPLDYPAQWTLAVTEGYVGELWPRGRTMMRQDLIAGYRHDGGHFIIRRDALFKPEGARRILAFVPPAEETLDIDTLQDLQFAEFLLQHRRATPGRPHGP